MSLRHFEYERVFVNYQFPHACLLVNGLPSTINAGVALPPFIRLPWQGSCLRVAAPAIIIIAASDKEPLDLQSQLTLPSLARNFISFLGVTDQNVSCKQFVRLWKRNECRPSKSLVVGVPRRVKLTQRGKITTTLRRQPLRLTIERPR